MVKKMVYCPTYLQLFGDEAKIVTFSHRKAKHHFKDYIERVYLGKIIF